MNVSLGAGLFLVLLCAPAMAQTSCPVPPVTISHTGSASPNTNPVQLVFVDINKFPDAVCNDGSPAGFVIRRGLNSAANRWVLFLQPGGLCIDQASCQTRAKESPQLVGSEYYGKPSTGPNQNFAEAHFLGAGNGILSPDANDNPDFWDATIVESLYCSSDFYQGDKPGAGVFSPDNVQTWNFHGRAILSAALKTLKENYNLDNASDVLFAGASAGGVGLYLGVVDKVDSRLG